MRRLRHPRGEAGRSKDPNTDSLSQKDKPTKNRPHPNSENRFLRAKIRQSGPRCEQFATGRCRPIAAIREIVRTRGFRANILDLAGRGEWRSASPTTLIEASTAP